MRDSVEPGSLWSPRSRRRKTRLVAVRHAKEPDMVVMASEGPAGSPNMASLHYFHWRVLLEQYEPAHRAGGRE